MNKVILMGRLTKDPAISKNGDNTIARYTLAVDRTFKNKETGEREADFISCVAWNKSAEFVEKFLKKGTKILITGHIQTGSYEKDGVKHYTTDVVIESHEFCESMGKDGNGGKDGKGKDNKASGKDDQSVMDGFMNVPQGDEPELPFN